MIISENTGTAYAPCPAGTYQARCIRVIDLGTQVTDYQGETKIAKKLLMAFEILDTEVRRDDGQPFVVSKRFTASLHEKAALRKTLASWRGRDFTPQELKGFDLHSVMGKTCMISLVDSTKDGKTYTNIAAIMKAPKGMAAPEGTANETELHWDMSKPDWAVFAQLSARLVEQIEASPEFKALKQPTGRIALGAPSTPHQDHFAPPPESAYSDTAAGAGSGFDDMSDDIPF